MDFNKFKKLVKKTRCIRRFDATFKIDSKDLIEVIDVARFVSSAKNIKRR